MGIVLSLILIIISAAIIWYSTAGFEKAADYLGRNLSKGVKGATINAVASSMPEFLATTFFLFYLKDVNSFSGGVGITAGSAVFNLLVIPFAVLLKAFFTFQVFNVPLDRKIIYRDGIYLIVTNILLIFVIRNTTLDWFHGLLLVGIYFLYFLYMLHDIQRLSIKKSSRKKQPNPDPVKSPDASSPGESRPKCSLEKIILGKCEMNRKNAVILLLISTIIMSLGTWLLVLGTELLGKDQFTLAGFEFQGLGIPIIFISVLLAAAASSIPDTMISIRDTRKGNFSDAISNAFGSNTFDISFALGLPLLAYTLIYGPISMEEEVRVWSLSMWILLLFLNIIVFLLFTSGTRIGKTKGTVLIILYIIFVVFVIEEAGGHPVTEGIARWFIDL